MATTAADVRSVLLDAPDLTAGPDHIVASLSPRRRKLRGIEVQR